MRNPILLFVIAVTLVSSYLLGSATDFRGATEHATLVDSTSSSSDTTFRLELAGDNVCNPRVQVCDS